MSVYKRLLERAECRLNYEMLTHFNKPTAIERWDLWQERIVFLQRLAKDIDQDDFDVALHRKLITLIKDALAAAGSGKTRTADRQWRNTMKLASQLPLPSKKKRRKTP